MTDAWLDSNLESESINIKSNDCNTKSSIVLEFEDNFVANSPSSGINKIRNNINQHNPLPDSDTYLQGLERKLENLRKGSKLVKALSEKKEDCWRTLLQQDNPVTCGTENNNEIIELESSINNRDSTVHEIYRHIQPVQPVTVGELVHIVNFDQLEQQSQAEENLDENTQPVNPETN